MKITTRQILTPEFSFSYEPEGEHYRGNCSAIDPETDRAVENWIANELNRGNDAAWCTVTVRASVEVDGCTFAGHAGLGMCSYRSEADLRAGCFTDPDGYGPDLKSEALEDLRRTLAAYANPQPDSRKGKARKGLRMLATPEGA